MSFEKPAQEIPHVEDKYAAAIKETESGDFQLDDDVLEAIAFDEQLALTAAKIAEIETFVAQNPDTPAALIKIFDRIKRKAAEKVGGLDETVLH